MGNGKGFGKYGKGGGKGGKGGGKGGKGGSGSPTRTDWKGYNPNPGIRSGCSGILPRSLRRKPPGSKDQEPSSGSRGQASS